MNRRVVTAIARKDLLEVLSNRAAWLPALVVPLIFVVVMPLLVLVLPQVAPPAATNAPSPKMLSMLLEALPADMRQLLAGHPPAQQMAILVVGQLFAPMFLVVPLMLATLIGANAFVGEKERKTLEALLYTPATDAEIFVGKTLASLLPAVVIAWASFGVYSGVVNAGSWPILGRLWFPTVAWWPLILWVVPAIATLGLIVTVIISARVSTFMEANQSAGVLVLGVVGLMASQLTGVVMLSVPAALILGGVIWLADALLIRWAIRIFSRSRLMERL